MSSLRPLGLRLFDIATEMKKVMFDDVGIYRTEKGMAEALEKERALKERFKEVGS